MSHPPTPGPFVRPNFLAVMEAVGSVTFPISKRELIDHVGEGTVLLQGRNVALHDLIKDIHDDHFESEDEFLAAIETEYTTRAAGFEETDASALPTGPGSTWQTRAGPGDAAGPESFIEPPE